MKQPLFNKYEAMNQVAQEISSEIGEAIRLWLDKYEDSFLMNDLELVAMAELTGQTSERRIRNALKIRREERCNTQEMLKSQETPQETPHQD
jgi:hypothetical protein